MNKSIPVAESIEFINVKGISPLISKCDIKVFYLDKNRNKSDIRKNVATQMAQTLPGCPIVGQYVKEKGDFLDHGRQMVIDGKGARVNTLTKPYGFVPLGAKVWFQDFDDVDKFGEVTRRTYLVTEGYLWTGQFEECKRAVEEGNPQSMELDDKTLKGYWSTDYNLGVEFFIINDAIISKLCMLGDDVEPCFEGASVTAPEISSTFSKSDNSNDDFSATLFTMMKQLRELKNNKGGYSMDGVMDNSLESTQIENQDSIENVKTTFDDGGDAGSTGEGSVEAGETTETPAEGGAAESTDVETTPAEGSTENAPSTEETEVPPVTGGDQEDASAELEEEIEQACINVPKKTEFVKKEDKEEEKPEENKDSEDKGSKSESNDNENDKEEEKKKYSLLEEQFNELQGKYSLLENEVVELRKFKETADNQKKDELIKSFYMLSDEDKKEVVENKTKYSLDEIEAKLSVICVRKKVNFNLVEEEETSNNNDVVTTYNLNAPEADMLPAWLKAVKDVQSRNDD